MSQRFQTSMPHPGPLHKVEREQEGEVGLAHVLMMNFNDQNRECHSERSEESVSPGIEILRCAQNDKTGLDCKNS